MGAPPGRVHRRRASRAGAGLGRPTLPIRAALATLSVPKVALLLCGFRGRETQPGTAAGARGRAWDQCAHPTPLVAVLNVAPSTSRLLSNCAHRCSPPGLL